MIQSQIQQPDYWGRDFALADSDIEQIYNHFLEVEKPQTIDEIARVIVASRVAAEQAEIERRLAGRTIYMPGNSFNIGDELVFPALKFAQSSVTAVREGYNPTDGKFNVISVLINGKQREFAADLESEHGLNFESTDEILGLGNNNIQDLYDLYGAIVEEKLFKTLSQREEFIRLGQEWFVKALMADVNVGHLHLAEAVLDMSGGGPLNTDEIVQHLDMDPSLDPSVIKFSLNYGLLSDARFDEVAPEGEVSWFLKRLEPDSVQTVPERLQYKSIPYDRALLSPQLLQLERELDDEWSDLTPPAMPQSVTFTLIYPHRWAGTLPLTAKIRPLFQKSNSPRQRVVFIDEFTQEEIVGWVVQEFRYVFGIKEWYEANGIPIGGYVRLTPGEKPGSIMLGYDRRRAQREWVRLASSEDGRLHFELKRRSVPCGFDDLMIVGTDVKAAIDALWRQAENKQRSISSLVAEVFPELAEPNPQKTVHAKTLYSAVNMLKRMPPGPLFAELVRHPAFQPVGDHYWTFDQGRWHNRK